jgi:hypothetical protein
MPRSYKWYSLRFLHSAFCIQFFPMWATYSTHLILLDFIIFILHCTVEELCNYIIFASCYFLLLNVYLIYMNPEHNCYTNSFGHAIIRANFLNVYLLPIPVFTKISVVKKLTKTRKLSQVATWFQIQVKCVVVVSMYEETTTFITYV